MSENTLEIVQKGNYKNVDLTKMKDGDFITVTKKYATAKEIVTRKDFGDGEKETTSYLAGFEYKGEEVGCFLPRNLHSNTDTIVWSADIAKAFNECGGEGDKIRISCKKSMSPATYDYKPKHKKGDDIIKIDLTFEKVE